MHLVTLCSPSDLELASICILHLDAKCVKGFGFEFYHNLVTAQRMLIDPGFVVIWVVPGVKVSLKMYAVAVQ